MTEITASLLYNLVQCPKRVELDLFADPKDRDPISPFTAMLWRRGSQHENEIIEAGDTAVLDLSTAPSDQKEALTLAAMHRGEPLIYGGRISADGLVGIPDLLRKEGRGYAPIDIKSGAALKETDDYGEGSPKPAYGVQIALYVDVLDRLGLSSGRTGYILDIDGLEAAYDLTAPQGKRKPNSLWDDYLETLSQARAIVAKDLLPKGALSASCKLCHWYSACAKTLREDGDLTLVPFLGRSLRDVLAPTLPTLHDLAACDPEEFITKNDKTQFPGVGFRRLKDFQARAILLTTPNAKPYLKAPISLPVSEVEFFFDIEVDPLRDLTYLHGVIERRGGDSATERFHAFFADDETPEAEKAAFSQALAFLQSVPDATIWYYSKYERTTYRKLQQRYPDVCSAQDIEDLFNPKRAIDLYYDVVTKATEWPTNDYSIKSLAKYLGFKWRDTNPSGAASIEWFDQWVQTKDPAIKTRIIDYNEDDCIATRVLLDGVRAL